MKRPMGIFPSTLLRVLPIAVLLLIGIWYGATLFAQVTIRKEVNERLSAEATHKADVTARNLETLLEATRALAANDLVVNGVIDTQERDTYLKPFFRSLRFPGPPNAQITMIDYQGRIIASNWRGSVNSSIPWMNSAMFEREMVHLSDAGLRIHLPIMYSGLSEGSVTLEYGPQETAEIMGLTSEVTVGAVIEDTGRVLFSSNPEVAQVGAMDPGSDIAGWVQRRALVPGFPGLTVISAQREGAAFGPVRAMNRFLLMAMAADVLALVVGISLTARLVTTPISVLAGKVREIRVTEDLKTRVPVAGPGEVRDLATAFNNMAGELLTTTVSKDYVDSILNSMTECVVVVSPEGTIQTVNPAACRLLGYLEHELLGHPLGRIWPDAVAAQPSSSPNDNGSKTRPEELTTGSWETTYLSKEGRAIPVLSSRSYISDGHSQNLGMVCVAQDISELKRVEEELRRHRDHLEDLVLDRTKELTATNQLLSEEVSERSRVEEALTHRNHELEALFNIASILAQPGGFELKSARGIHEVSRVAEGDGVILRLPGQEDRSLSISAASGIAIDRPQTLHPSQDIAGAAFELGSPIVANDYATHPLADPYTVALGIASLMSVPIKADGRTLGVVTVLSKEAGHFSVNRISLLTAIGDQLGMLLENARLHDEITVREELERRMNTFISLASHELRTPMTTIMGFAELLGSRQLPDATRRESLEVIVRNTQRLASLVDDLLNVSRIQSGQLAVDLGSLPLSEIIEEEVSATRTKTEIHQFLVDIPRDTPAVIADRDKLAQIMTNLLDNAVKYSPKGGPISVRAEYQEDRQRVVMSIRDRGMGIAPEHLDGLFTTFGRIQRTETEGIGGSGLGLYLVKELVTLQHGEVWLESELDQGSTFFFSIPTEYIENVGNSET